MIQHPQRIPFRDLDTLSPDDRDYAERGRVRGEILNLFKVLMNHPALARRWGVFANHILHKQTLPPREREMAILRIGWLNQARYEWEQHVRIAKAAGLSAEEIERIAEGPGAGWDPVDAALLQAADDLFTHSVVAPERWAVLTAHFSMEQVMDLVFTIGQYNLVSWALNSFGVPLDADLEAAP
jgi:4-carboxymuconolactone decarboxylase